MMGRAEDEATRIGALEAELHTLRRAIAHMCDEKDALAAGLQASEELFRTFMNNSPIASFIKDAEGRFVFYNRKYAETFGVGGESPASATEAVPADARGATAGRDEEPANGVESPDQVEPIFETMEEVRDRTGHLTQWRAFRFPCRDALGRALVGGVAIDVTGERERSEELARYQSELEEANDRLRNLVVTDELTGLRNRRAFEERLSIEFAMARRKNRDLAVALLDADNFKRVNDELGHAAGDRVLKQLAGGLEATVRLTDLAVRYGGEEFAVILTESDERSAMLWAARLQRTLAAAKWEGRPITVSIGVAGLTSGCEDGNELVRLADEALYRAKGRGKNCAVGAGELKR